jgi:hypothetical protein
MPITMLHRPKKRSWPSFSSSRRVKVRRQPPGEMNGNRPSNTRTSASADQNVSRSKGYFFAGEAGDAEPPRNARKKSELAGSITSTSERLLNAALYASRLR